MPIFIEIQLYRIHKTVLVWAVGQVSLPLLPSRILAIQRPGLELGSQWPGRHQCFMEVKKVKKSTASGAPGQGPKVQQAREHAGLCPQTSPSGKLEGQEGSKREDYRTFLRKLNSAGTTDWQERRRLKPRLRLCEMSSNEERGLWKAGGVLAGSSSNPSCVL